MIQLSQTYYYNVMMLLLARSTATVRSMDDKRLLISSWPAFRCSQQRNTFSKDTASILQQRVLSTVHVENTYTLLKFKFKYIFKCKLVSYLPVSLALELHVIDA